LPNDSANLSRGDEQNTKSLNIKAGLPIESLLGFFIGGERRGINEKGYF